MKDSFVLAWRALVRGHVLTLLLVATALAHVFLPALVRSDGTDAGWREMFIRAVPGAAIMFITVAILACACGLFAQERERFRLSLTVVRPASAFGVALGRWLALCAAAAVALLFTALLTAFRLTGTPNCMHHHVPQLPPPVESAREALKNYLQDPDQIKDPALRAVVTNSTRAAVLRLLENKEMNRYDVVLPGKTMSWPFPAELAGADQQVSVRVRFATQFDIRSPFEGAFAFGPHRASVTNSTQMTLIAALGETTATNSVPADGSCELVFSNHGKVPVMLRPRRDLELLTPGDAFLGNLFRAMCQTFTTIALLAAFGLFLSAAVSRPVALFTAFIAVIVTLMTPSVIAQFPDEMDTTFTERFGLAVSRIVSALTSTVSSAAPISDLSTDVCVEWSSLLRSLAVNFIALPAAFLAGCAWLVRRKPLADNS